MAKALNTQGRLLWTKGELEQALETWKQATLNYAEADDKRGVVISQINQAKALQALGLSHNARELLESTYRNLQEQPDITLQIIGLQSLGRSLRRVGELNHSLVILQEGLQLAQLPNHKSSALLEIGNTEQALANRALAIGENEQAERYTQAALQSYQEAIAAANSPRLRLPAQLNQFSLLVESGDWVKALELWPELLEAIADIPPSRTSHIPSTQLRQKSHLPQTNC